MDVSPGEIDKPFASPTVDDGAPEVRALRAVNHVNRDDPRGTLAVSGHQIPRLPPDLDADVHVVARFPVEMPRTSRKIATPDFQQHERKASTAPGSRTPRLTIRG